MNYLKFHTQIIFLCMVSLNILGGQKGIWNAINGQELKEFSAYIPLATRKPGNGAKVIGLLVYSGNEFYADMCKVPEKIEAMQTLISNLAKTNGNGNNTELEFICYAYGNQKDAHFNLSRFIDMLAKNNGQKDVSLLIFAHGENPDVVNRACHSINPKITVSSLIYFQPTIYETYLTPLGIKENNDLQTRPVKFKKLYNLYTKTSDLRAINPLYPERKYRQQPLLVNGELLMRIKNVRMFKVAQRQLEDYTNQDFFSAAALKNLPALLTLIDSYSLNFDLLAVGFNKENTMSPLVAINRFIQLTDTGIKAEYGMYPFEGMYDVKLLSPEINMQQLQQQFTSEFLKAQEALSRITKLPAARGWYGAKQLGSEIDEIKRRYQKIEESKVLAPPPVPPRSQEPKVERPLPVPPPPHVEAPQPKLPAPARPSPAAFEEMLKKGKGQLRGRQAPEVIKPSQQEKWQAWKDQNNLDDLENELKALNKQLFQARVTQNILSRAKAADKETQENNARIMQLTADIAFIQGLLPAAEKQENWD